MNKNPYNKTEVSERLRYFRNQVDRSMESFARDLGVSYQTISNYERGRSDISIHTLHKIIEVFNLNPVWLLTGSGEPFLSSSENDRAFDDFEREMESLKREVMIVRRDNRKIIEWIRSMRNRAVHSDGEFTIPDSVFSEKFL